MEDVAKDFMISVAKDTAKDYGKTWLTRGLDALLGAAGVQQLRQSLPDPAPPAPSLAPIPQVRTWGLLGEQLINGDAKVRFTGARTQSFFPADTIADTYYPDYGKQFLEVFVTIENTGRLPLSLSYSEFAIVAEDYVGGIASSERRFNRDRFEDLQAGYFNNFNYALDFQMPAGTRNLMLYAAGTVFAVTLFPSD